MRIGIRLGHIVLTIGLAAFLSGCGDWPDPVVPGERSARDADFPELVPLSTILGGMPGASGPEALPTAARIAALEARAAALRGPVIDRATRARMDRGVDAGALAGAR